MKLDRFKAIGLLVLCLFLVPLIGWFTGRYIESEYESQFRDVVINQQKYMTAEAFAERRMSYVTFCESARREAADKNLQDFCSSADEIDYVKLASGSTAVLGLCLFALILGGRLIAGTNRARMSLIFGPLVRVVMLLLAVSVLAQGALFVYSAYTLEATALHRVHGGLLLAVSIGALGACWVLLKASLAFLKSEPMFIRGAHLDRSQHQSFFDFVDQIAKKLKAQTPDHIVVGLEPNFFVTAADVRLVGQETVLRGRTLFVSLGLMRLFKVDEFKAVIGHELGHFRGDDVAYSMKFAPTYSRLGKALNGLSQTTGSVADLGRLPAMVALSMCLTEFASAERTVGRERELLADQAGAEAADASALARALVKVSLFAPQWNALTRAHIDELAEGRMFTNLAQTYAGSCSSLTSELDWSSVREELAKSSQPHPVDTHPPLLQRLQNLKTSLYDISLDQCGAPERSAIELIENVEAVEESLSVLEARWLVAVGAVVLPAPDSQDTAQPQ